MPDGPNLVDWQLYILAALVNLQIHINRTGHFRGRSIFKEDELTESVLSDSPLSIMAGGDKKIRKKKVAIRKIKKGSIRQDRFLHRAASEEEAAAIVSHQPPPKTSNARSPSKGHIFVAFLVQKVSLHKYW